MYLWNIKEMKLINQKGGIFLGNEHIFIEESHCTREEKIAFVDQMNEGLLSYILNLAEQYQHDLPSLPKTTIGTMTSKVFAAWVKRNDTRSIGDNSINIGRFHILGTYRNLRNLNQKTVNDTYTDIVDECFHRQLKQCERQERKYFEEHDEYSILKKKVSDYADRFHTTFGVNIGQCSNGQMMILSDTTMKKQEARDITLAELQELYQKYNQLEAFIFDLTTKTHIVY